MATKYLDSVGLAYFWSKIKAYGNAHWGGGGGASVLDYYPIGSYYETSDTTFDPNVTWGGTWSLETEGLVHIGAGANYTAGDTGGNESESYTPNGTVGGTTLTDAQIAHGHGHSLKLPDHKHSFTQPKGPSHQHYLSFTKDGASGSAKWTCHTRDSSGTSDFATNSAGTGSCTGGAVGDPSTNPAISGSVTNLHGASSTRTAHDHSFTGTASTIDVMQPYVVVNRWHRTA